MKEEVESERERGGTHKGSSQQDLVTADSYATEGEIDARGFIVCRHAMVDVTPPFALYPLPRRALSRPVRFKFFGLSRLPRCQTVCLIRFSVLLHLSLIHI